MRAARLSLRETGPHLDAIVRHISPVAGAPDQFLVGLEFVNMSPATGSDLDRVVREWEEKVERSPSE
jgi:hypothetical protein